MEILLVILGIIVVLAFIVIGIYNRLVALRQTCNQAWSDIEVQLKQRQDLVPQLVNTVKGYAKQNKIAASRRFYNNAAQEYNTSREQFPAILVAGPFGFSPREFFEAPEGREALQEAPVVDFDT